MTKKYRLKKELPGIPAGTLFVKEVVARGCLCFHTVDSQFYGQYFGSLPSRVKDKVWFAEWFEEIPPYDFVKSGDIYLDPSDGSYLITFDACGHWCIGLEETKRWYQARKTTWPLVEPGDAFSPIEALKPENLVYRPGEVDKLGWDTLKDGIYLWGGNYFVISNRRYCRHLQSGDLALLRHNCHLITEAGVSPLKGEGWVGELSQDLRKGAVYLAPLHEEKAPCEGKEIEIDGKTYILKEKKI